MIRFKLIFFVFICVSVDIVFGEYLYENLFVINIKNLI